MQVILLSSLVTATGTVESTPNALRTYQATVVGTGTVTATVIIEGTNDQITYLPIGTITLTGTTSNSDGFASSAPWASVRARITAISGTGALCTVSMGY